MKAETYNRTRTSSTAKTNTREDESLERDISELPSEYSGSHQTKGKVIEVIDLTMTIPRQSSEVFSSSGQRCDPRDPQLKHLLYSYSQIDS